MPILIETRYGGADEGFQPVTAWSPWNEPSEKFVWTKGGKAKIMDKAELHPKTPLDVRHWFDRRNHCIWIQNDIFKKVVSDSDPIWK